METQKKGYYNKYKVERTDGKPFTDQNDQFMVMCFARDRHAATAVLHYAESVRSENPELAMELTDVIAEYWDVKYNYNGHDITVVPKNT